MYKELTTALDTPAGKQIETTAEKVLSGEMSSKNFSDLLRKFNFNNADDVLMKKTGKTIEALQGEYGFKITRHEDLNMKKVFYVPYEIHANLGHTGGIGNYKFNFYNIPNISNLVGEKTAQVVFRYGFKKLNGALAGN